MQLSSSNQTILLLSDPHQEIDRLEVLLKKENYDMVVCLGDWFDSFRYNTFADTEKTCDLLKKWIGKTNFITLYGNHDLPYLYDNPNTICSGYTVGKDQLITDKLGSFLPFIRTKFQWYIWIDDFLCTHAGLHPYNLSPMQSLEKDKLSNWLDQQTAQAEMNLINGGQHWTYKAGYARGGSQRVGGITWLDFNEEFDVIPELKQIVGHTVGRGVRPHAAEGSVSVADWRNICIDCFFQEYLIIHNQQVTVKKYSDL